MFSQVPFANTDHNLTHSLRVNYTSASMKQCYFFDKGYSKLRIQCLKKNPSTTCKSQLENTNPVNPGTGLNEKKTN